MQNEHVYVNGERKSPTDIGGYIHVGPNGQTLGPNMDIDVALQFGYTAGLTFVSLSNGDVAVIGTDAELTAKAAEGDRDFEEAGRKLLAGALAKARQEARAKTLAKITEDMGDNPLAGLMKALFEAKIDADDAQRDSGQNIPSRGRELPSFSDFLQSIGEEDDCQCENCKQRRGEL